MTVTAHHIKKLIDQELSLCSDRRVVQFVRELLVEPEATMRRWDYGEIDTRYECWTVLIERGGLGIAYSEYGFGPKSPWGLVRVTGSDSEASIGMDSGWYPRFMDAFFESAASELAIWRVFRQAGGEPYPGTPVSPESSWDATWKEVMRLRESDPSAQYNHHHSVVYGRDEA